MRTVRRAVRELNIGKRTTLTDLLRAFAAEKHHWLEEFAQRENRPFIKNHRVIRDASIAAGYQSNSGLQARMWKLALVEAAETWDKYYQALFVELRHRIAKQDFGEEKRHYAFWLLAGYTQFFACLDGKVPMPEFAIDLKVCRRIVRYVRRQAKELHGAAPIVRQARSLVLDADCYSVFTEHNKQYLKIMTLTKNRRMALPLLGFTPIAGTIRIVDIGSRVEVHLSQDINGKELDGGMIVAIDFGYTEAAIDTEGHAYGVRLGKILTATSNERNAKSKMRNKLRALARSYAVSNNALKQRKARHLRKYNLGQQKWNRREGKARQTIACEINQGLNALLKKQHPFVLVTEDLRHAFSFDKPKTWNRRLSAWTKGVLQDRVAFKALVEGFHHEQVNPAYSSQLCPQCDYVDAKNRVGDQFACLFCKHEDQSDRVAALNHERRYGDREIARYTPYRDVKTILMQRFHRRLEAEGKPFPEATVPGRTSDTAWPIPLRHRAMAQQGDGNVNLAVTRRAKQSGNAIECGEHI